MSNVFYTFTTTKDGNLAYHVGDIKENVDKNRENLAKRLKYNNKDLVYMNQTHSCNVQIVNKNSSKLIDDCDALISKEKDLPLMVMVADCIPILLLDEKKGVIAAIHAGRNSTFLKITQKVLEIMKKEFLCEPSNIKAILGPSIQKCCYEVGDDLLKIVKKTFGEKYIFHKNIDLQSINSDILYSFGVKNIEISNICTKCSKKEYYSYRKQPKTGRFAGIIKL